LFSSLRIILSRKRYNLETVYHIEMNGIDFLRNMYIASGLSIKPKTRLSKMETLKEMIRDWGMNPEQILIKQALTNPEVAVITEQNQIRELSNALKEMMRKEILNAEKV
jgi:hypothetical protein